MAIDVEELKSLIGKKPQDLPNEQEEDNTEKPSMPPETAPAFELDDDGEEYMPVGVEGVLAASEKLLAINRGLTPTDERDSLKYQKIIRPYAMLQKSIKMDAGKVARQAMYQAAKRKNLSGITSGQFDNYVNNLLVGNPLTSPLEEINPMQLTANARRITKMGPGGLGSSQSITEEAQAIHPSQFGFISSIEGPECTVDAQVLTKTGWVQISEITTDTELACRVDGRLEFHKPERVIHEHYKGTMYGVKNMNTSLLVTPNHRFLYYTPGRYDRPGKWSTAQELYGKIVAIPCTHEAYLGTDHAETISLDEEHVYDREDWCSLVGWVISEGSRKESCIVISQSEDVHPENYKEIVTLLQRMGIRFSEQKASSCNKPVRGDTKHTSVTILDPDVNKYFSQYDKKCYDLRIPEEIFEWSVACRKALLASLLAGDGRENKTHTTYCTVSKKLAIDVERLMICLGYSVTLREEKDKRPRVKTTHYAVSALKIKYRHLETPDKRYAPYWYKQEYDGMVHCATVPGGMLFTAMDGHPGVWTGNSERAGIDVRAAMGTKIGTDGRLYQKFYDRRRKKYRWLSPVDIDGLVMKLPD